MARFLFFLSFLALGVRALDCYYPSGSLASRDTPCDVNADAANPTFCCATGYACLNNTLCLRTNAATDSNSVLYNRGSCTDQTWRSGNCPNFCTSNTQGGGALSKCSGTNVDRYCCNESKNCNCTTGDNAVQFAGQFLVETTISPKSTSTSSSSTSTSLSSSATTTPLSSNTTTSTSSTATNTSPASQTTSSTSESSSPPAEKKSSSNSTAIGAGVGVSVGVVVLGALGFFFWKRRQRKGGEAVELPAEGQVQESRQYFPVEERRKEEPHMMASSVQHELDSRPPTYEMGEGK